MTTLYGCGSKPMRSHFGVGKFTTHFRTYFSGWIGSRSLGDNRKEPWGGHGTDVPNRQTHISPFLEWFSDGLW